MLFDLAMIALTIVWRALSSRSCGWRGAGPMNISDLIGGVIALLLGIYSVDLLRPEDF